MEGIDLKTLKRRDILQKPRTNTTWYLSRLNLKLTAESIHKRKSAPRSYDQFLHL